ncbi:MAG: hypothetical protein H6733_06665 [Alphaproteobacteria bacterium]|nr:hypothetical protein [Alphaproteobacteria bacterium]
MSRTPEAPLWATAVSAGPGPSAPVCTVAEVLDACHPTLLGRVQVRRGSVVAWVPTLQDLPVRAGDRVLVLQPEAGEAVVVGVVDGFRRRPEPVARAGVQVSVLADEVVEVAAHDGTPLVQVRRGPEGPVVRLCTSAVALEVPGTLDLSAEALTLRARSGPLRVEATDDVVVRGEVIRLN